MIIDRTAFSHDDGMKFFTRELYLKLQSEDDEIAFAAQEAWEERLSAYAEHLRRIKKYDRYDKLSRLAHLRLHDYQVLDSGRESLNRGRDDLSHYLIPYEMVVGREQQQQVIESSRVPFTVRLKGAKGYLTLAYFLWSHVVVGRPQTWLSGAIGKTFWLYDELDVLWPGTAMYVHRILLSDGYTFMIPFNHAEVVGDGAPIGEAYREDI